MIDSSCAGAAPVRASATERVICFISARSKYLISRPAVGLPMASRTAATSSDGDRIRPTGLGHRRAAAMAMLPVSRWSRPPAGPTISVRDTPKRELSSSTTTTSPRATTRPLTMTSTGSPTRWSRGTIAPRPELHQVGDRHRGRAEDHLHQHRDAQDRIEVPATAQALVLRALRLGLGLDLREQALAVAAAGPGIGARLV